MNCPFCTETLSPEAIVCKSCGRDITVPKPLMAANQLLVTKVEALEAENIKLQAAIESYRLSADPMGRVGNMVLLGCAYIILPVATILGLHFVLIVLLDVSELILRIAVIATSSIFGLAFALRHRTHAFVKGWFAAIIAVASVFAMSAVMYFRFNLEIVPKIPAQKIEMAEYMVSIALAFIFGSLVAVVGKSLSMPRAMRGNSLPDLLAAFIAHNMPHRSNIHFDQRVEFWARAIRIGITGVTAAGALYSGFRKFHLLA